MNSYTGQAMGGQELVQYAGDNLQVGNCCVPYPYYYPIYEQHYHNWYPSTQFITEKSKVEQSFKVVGKMLETKIITKQLNIKEFIKLVNDIAELL